MTASASYVRTSTLMLCVSFPLDLLESGAQSLHLLPSREQEIETTVHLSRSCICDRRYLPGVPGNKLDLAVDRAYTGGPCVVTVGRKTGRYDRITVRAATEQYLHSARASIDSRAHEFRVCEFHVPDAVTECRITREGDEVWRAEYRRLRCTVVRPETSASILQYHWSHYYRGPVTRERCEELAEAFQREVVAASTERPLSLSDANRMASRMLYRAAVEDGWRKYTAREKRACGITAPGHWFPRDYSRMGVGEYSEAHAEDMGRE